MIFRIPRSCALEAPRGPKMAPRRPKMAPRRLQGGPRWPHEGSKRAHAGPKRAPGGPKMAPRGLQEGPHGGSKRDLGTNLAQRALPEAPGTLPDPSGERFRDQFGPKSGPQEATLPPVTLKLLPRFLLPAALRRGHGGGVCRRQVDTHHMSSSRTPRITHTTRLRVTRREKIRHTFEPRARGNMPYAFGQRMMAA